jgi:hypothetical protein
MVGLPAADRDDGVSASRLRLADQKLEFAQLVAPSP